MGVYAIGLNRHWVEIRSALIKPEEVRTKRVRTVKVPASFIENHTGRAFEKELVLEIIYHKGGKVIGCIPLTKWVYFVGKYNVPSVKKGGIVQVLGPMADNLRSAEWWKANNI